MIRLFVAIDFPPPVRERLAGLQGGVPGARWNAADTLHLTLRFIGEVPENQLGDIDAALGGIAAPAFTLTLDGVGGFGSGRGTRILWAGTERSDALSHLAAKVESALVRCGLPAEERRFTPHVTLARLRNAPADRVARFLAERSFFRAGPVPVVHFTLYRSLLGKGGPVYEPLALYPLSGGAE